MSYEPYAPNAQGLTEALIDLKNAFPGIVAQKVTGYETTAFENLNQGDAVYSRASDGQIGKAIASSTLDKAFVAGFVETTVSQGQTARVIVAGAIANSGLDAGDEYYLSAASAGAIVKTPPSTAGQYVTRVGEAVNTAQLVIRLEPPILLS
tara:strand:+ start:381 stop:833 length:453 start_codon:yes stop_codon:yes gene_type:complete